MPKFASSYYMATCIWPNEILILFEYWKIVQIALTLCVFCFSWKFAQSEISINTSFTLCYSFILSKIVPQIVMGLSPGLAWDLPRPVHFSRDWARNSKKGPSSTQARDRFLEKGLENWDFYVVKNTGSSRLEIELLWRAWARAWLEIDIQGSGLARDRFFRARPITNLHLQLNLFLSLWFFLEDFEFLILFCDVQVSWN